MFEKVNPMHPDKIADRIAGRLVDIAYEKNENPKIAVEVLIGHGKCHIIAETSENITEGEIKPFVERLVGPVELDMVVVKQDPHLAENQRGAIRCGDNGIFKGVPATTEEQALAWFARVIYSHFPTDGKYIIDEKTNKTIVCQSNATEEEIRKICIDAIINPLGEWTGGPNVDSGATNRKLGSDMAGSVTGGGLHGKDLSKADVSVNIYAWLKAQKTQKPVELFCAIGDEMVDGKPYAEIVEIAREYIKSVGGFEKFAEWGLL